MTQREQRQKGLVEAARKERKAKPHEVVAEEIRWTIRGADPNELEQPTPEYLEAEFD